MRKRWNDIKALILLFAGWRLLLGIVEYASSLFFIPQNDFRGPIAWANFDGVHYLSIAQEHYYQFQQAFFPLYPLLIRLFTPLNGIHVAITAVLLSHVLFLCALYFFMKFSKQNNKKNTLWPLVLLLLFPTSYYYAAAYSESLYFVLAVVTLFSIGKRQWLWAGIAGMLASSTRLFGIYLLIPAIIEYVGVQKKHFRDILSLALMPMGLIGYMIYLWLTVGDPLAFIHVQPAFGANRSGGEFIFLPQVLWRYVKIFATADLATFQYKVALFEFLSFLFAFYLLVRAWKTGLKSSYIWYSLLVLLTPTLTGTLSSFPRYILGAFPIFIVLDTFSSREKVLFAVLFTLTLIYFASAFLQGYFVA